MIAIAALRSPQEPRRGRAIREKLCRNAPRCRGNTTFGDKHCTNRLAANHRKRIVFYLNCEDHHSDPHLSGCRSMLSSADAAPASDLSLSLPPSAYIRWKANHKATVIIAIRSGIITFSEACERYRLSYQELAAWETAFDQDGMAALQVKYRRPAVREDG